MTKDQSVIETEMKHNHMVIPRLLSAMMQKFHSTLILIQQDPVSSETCGIHATLKVLLPWKHLQHLFFRWPRASQMFCCGESILALHNGWGKMQPSQGNCVWQEYWRADAHILYVCKTLHCAKKKRKKKNAVCRKNRCNIFCSIILYECNYFHCPKHCILYCSTMQDFFHKDIFIHLWMK